MTDAARTATNPAASPPFTGLPVGPFFLIVALAVSIGAFLLLRDQPLSALVVIAITLVGAGLAGAAVYRVLGPLTGAPVDPEPLVGGRTRMALERDKALTLRTIKELEFDRAMGKVSEPDFVDMRDRLRARAVRLMRDLEGTALYRTQIEQDLARFVPGATSGATTAGTCVDCGAVNDPDARFCKMCGRALVGHA